VPPQSYVIVSGDTCGGIANKFGVSYADFVALNNLNDASCTRIQIGDTLLIPAPTPTPGPTETISPDYTPPAAQPTAALPADGLYEVKQGDSCGKIAEQFQITVDAIIQQNPELNLNQQCLIRAGDKLRVAAGGGTPTPVATAFVLAPPTPRAGYAAPGALAPVDNARVEQGSVLLEWLAVGTLKSNEWYVVQIQPAGAITVPIFETRGTSLRLNADLLGVEDERAFAWWVQVRQRVGERDGVPVYNDMSPASTVRRFVWRRPTPTAEPTP
jgi:LysM repeat protein